MKKQTNFTIIRLSSIGDIVLTSALIRSIKSTYPEAKIDFITDKTFKEVLEFNPHINKLILYDKKNSLATNDILRNEISEETKIIDLQNNFRTKFLLRNFKQVAKMKKRRLQKLLLVHLKKTPKEQPIIPLLYIQTAEKFCIKHDGNGLEFWLEEEKKLDYYPPANNKQNLKLQRIGIAPGAKHFTKRWLTENFVELVEKIHNKFNVEFYLLGGISDMEICEEIVEKINLKKQSIKIQNMAGKTSLLASAKLIDSCDIIITNDTGLMHIAAARRIPIVAIFGSTVKELGFAPFGVEHIICEAEVSCRPCTHIGRTKCSKKHFDCMRKITAEKVFQDFEKFINNLLNK